MAETKSLAKTIRRIKERDPRFHKEAYVFILEALEQTYKLVDERRHVSAQELLEGIRSQAVAEFGYLARFTFAQWGVTETRHLGDLVYHLIEEKVLSQTDGDDYEDFIDVYDFEEAFDKRFEFPDEIEL